MLLAHPSSALQRDRGAGHVSALLLLHPRCRPHEAGGVPHGGQVSHSAGIEGWKGGAQGWTLQRRWHRENGHLGTALLGARASGWNRLCLIEPAFITNGMINGCAAPVLRRYILELMKKDIKPRDIMTRAAFENAMVTVMATGGSTNAGEPLLCGGLCRFVLPLLLCNVLLLWLALVRLTSTPSTSQSQTHPAPPCHPCAQLAVLHLIAMARSCGLELGLDDFQRTSDRIPFIADLKPSGKYVMEDLHKVGGTAVWYCWAGLLDGGANVRGAGVYDWAPPLSPVPQLVNVQRLNSPASFA